MPRKTYRRQEIIAKLRQGEGLIGRGRKVPEVIKALGVHEVTHYRWHRSGSSPPHMGISTLGLPFDRIP